MSKKNRGKPIYYCTHPNRWQKADGEHSYISVLESGDLIIRVRGERVNNGLDPVLDRRHARLLAKRILEALDDTK